MFNTRSMGIAVSCFWLGATSLACSSSENDEDIGVAGRLPLTVDESSALPALDLSETRVHLRTLGNPAGRVLILLHGGPGDDYRSLLPLTERAQGKSLADEHLLVVWDQRGAGQSRRHGASQITLEGYARDLEEIVDHFSPDAPVALLGHSWGGTYAVQFMNEHPERVYAAALLEPGGLAKSLRNDENIEAYAALFDEIVGSSLDRADPSREEHAQADQALGDFVAENDGDPAPFVRYGALAKRELEFGALQTPFDFTTHLDRLGFDVMLFAGSESGPEEFAKQERHRAVFPSARLQVIAGATHNGLTGAQAGEMIPLLVDYFAEHEPASAPPPALGGI